MKTLILTSMTAALSLATAANAGLPVGVDLFDANTSAHIDLTGNSAGMSAWVVDDVDRLALQGFWYRTQGMTREQNIGTLALTGVQTTDTNPFADVRPDTLAVRYTGGFGFSGGTFTIDPTWQIRGGGTGRADMAESIAITNNSTFEPLVISFFQYADFDLGPIGNTTADTLLQIVGASHNTAQQTGALYLNETVVTPAPTRWSASIFPTVASALEDNLITNLDNNSVAGPGDLVWAFQWDFVIQPGASVVISKDKSIVPAPGALALLGLGGVIAGRRRRA